MLEILRIDHQMVEIQNFEMVDDHRKLQLNVVSTTEKNIAILIQMAYALSCSCGFFCIRRWAVEISALRCPEQDEDGTRVAGLRNPWGSTTLWTACFDFFKSVEAHIKLLWLVVWLPFFIFPYIGNNHPNWLIFFRGVQTTNQCLYHLVFYRCWLLFSMIFLSSDWDDPRFWWHMRHIIGMNGMASRKFHMN